MQHPRFRSGEITTGFIAEEYPEGFQGAPAGRALIGTLRHRRLRDGDGVPRLLDQSGSSATILARSGPDRSHRGASTCPVRRL
jgi:hypothetical protein